MPSVLAPYIKHGHSCVFLVKNWLKCCLKILTLCDQCVRSSFIYFHLLKTAAGGLLELAYALLKILDSVF